MNYTNEKMREEWRRKPYQPVRNNKSNAEIAKDWMIEEFGFYAEKLLITPELAGQILSNMGLNRSLKKTGLLKYSSAMEKGKWELSPQGIIFDEDGKLLDGQHRLEAVIRSNTPTAFVAYFNVPHDMPIDKGISRSSADAIRISRLLPPELSTKDNMSMANAIFRVALSANEFKGINDDERAKFISRYRREVKIARLASYKGGQDLYAVRTGIRGGLLAAAICGVSEEILNEFSECVNTGCYTKDRPKNSALFLRRVAKEEKGKGGESAIKFLQSSTEQALMDFVNAKPRSQAYPTIAFPFSERVPVKEVIW